MRSAPSSPSCLRSARRPGATGRGSRERGRRGSISASPSSSVLGSASRNASGAAVCRSNAASSPIRAIGQPASAPARATGSATAHRANARTPVRPPDRSEVRSGSGPRCHTVHGTRELMVRGRLEPVATAKSRQPRNGPPGRVGDHVLQLAAARLDDARGRHVVLETRDQHAAQAKTAAPRAPAPGSACRSPGAAAPGGCRSRRNRPPGSDDR
jgi:hypothetical protein